MTREQGAQELGDRVQGRMLPGAAANPKTGQVLPKHVHPDMQFADHTQAVRSQKNGISRQTQIKLDQLARDFPALLDEVKQGKLSVNRAAIEAGFVKEVTALDLLKRGWANASDAERHAFFHFLGEDRWLVFCPECE